jgi:chromosome segregation ATPase
MNLNVQILEELCHSRLKEIESLQEKVRKLEEELAAAANEKCLQCQGMEESLRIVEKEINSLQHDLESTRMDYYEDQATIRELDRENQRLESRLASLDDRPDC